MEPRNTRVGVRNSKVSTVRMELTPEVPEGETSRKNSLRDAIIATHRPKRKDSVAPLMSPTDTTDARRKSSAVFGSNDLPEIVIGTEKVRRLSRKLSLKPPANQYWRRSPKKTSLERCNPGDSHTVRCECGLEISVKCEWGSAISSTSGTPVLPACSPNKETSEASERRKSTSLISTIERLETGNADLEFVIASCRELGHVEHQESLETVLSRQAAIKCLLDMMRQYAAHKDLQLAACSSILVHVKHSEASLHYLCVNEGIERLHHNMKTFGEDTDLLIVVLDIFGYYSFQDEWRCILTEKVQPSEILRTMACHEGDPNVVEKCCIVLENLALSEDIARSMMYVGGVHSILSMMSRYDKHVDVLKHCCTTLGTFASHDDTCQAVSEAGATSAVMLAMTSYITYPEIQQSCCWALASLSRADCVCMELLNIDAFGMLLKAMTSFPQDVAIQEYGCWALCNLVVVAPELEEDACRSALVLLLDSTQMFMANVELLEHVCYAISTLVAVRECVHVNVVKNDGISKLIELMKRYDDNVDIQLHSCKVIGNLAVNDNFRRYVEDMGASEAIISCMLGLEKNALIQSTGCMTLTNISAKVADNKFRILKNGGVHAALRAMAAFKEDKTITLNALKLLCNLQESDKGCWWIAEESGISVIAMSLRNFPNCPEIMAFGCSCLANLPRRGMNTVALGSAESSLLYLRQQHSLSTEVALALCAFYENALKAGTECGKLVTSVAMETMTQIMQDFEDIEIQVTGCQIMAQVVLGEHIKLLNRGVLASLVSTMNKYISNDDIQAIGCGTISYLSGSAEGLETLEELCCLEVVLECMRTHPCHAHLHGVCLLAIENMCRADSVRGSNIQNVCDAVSKSMKAHGDNNEIQLGGCHILSIIGSGFHRQNVQKRESVDFMGPLVTVTHRKSVTEELLDVASAAIHRLRKFTDGVLDDTEEGDSDASQTESTSDGVPIDNVYQ
ncbi:uncharacterized protein LOC128236279 [Mya arenaria]|uniref:uncharacterized protein LOC128236279 n=1 Tax=Mya arenaria TaxID=6604 RepID=UPI0022E380E5|nr:uncharacterized protein LOC128236279 [Mya arenaria]